MNTTNIILILAAFGAGYFLAQYQYDQKMRNLQRRLEEAQAEGGLTAGDIADIIQSGDWQSGIEQFLGFALPEPQ
jgi:hypothetical protein